VVSVRAFCCAVPTRTSAACHIKIRTWRVLTPARRLVPSADDEVDGSPGTGYPGKRAVHGITELAGLISTPASSLSSDRGATRGPGCAKGRANHRAVTIHAIRLKGGGIVCSRYDPEGPCDPDFQRGPRPLPPSCRPAPHGSPASGRPSWVRPGLPGLTFSSAS
jgi:hypothetical protein